MWVQSLGQEDSPEKETATHSSILAWRIPWTEEPGGLQSMVSQRVGYDLATEQQQTTNNNNLLLIYFVEYGSLFSPIPTPVHHALLLWRSTSDNRRQFFPQGICGNDWKHFRLSQPGEERRDTGQCYQHLVDRGQGCCQISYNM